jgi:Uri superfamily endonuclease
MFSLMPGSVEAAVSDRHHLNWAALPALPGTYVLVLRLERTLALAAGRLAPAQLAPGLFAYIGSARGPGGLRARVGRHLRADKKPRWHIDALVAVAPVERVWYAVTAGREECRWARTVRALPGVTAPIPGFGASDCACETHLLALPTERIAAAWSALGGPAEISLCP